MSGWSLGVIGGQLHILSQEYSLHKVYAFPTPFFFTIHYLQFSSSDDANRAFFILDQQCIVRSLFRTDELLDSTNAPSANALGGGMNMSRGLGGNRGGGGGSGGGGAPRFRGGGLGE